MKKHINLRRPAVLCVLLAALAAALAGAGSACAKLSYCAEASVRLNEGITPDSLEYARSSGCTFPDRYVLWNSYENKNIKHGSLALSSKVLAVEAWGDLGLAFPSSLIRGSYSTNDDISGCVIDADTALALYGSSDILGKEVVCGGRAYIVRGIVESGTRLFMFRRQAEKFMNLELVFGDGENAGMLAGVLLSHCGCSGYRLLEGGFYRKIIVSLLMLPGQIAALFIAFTVLKLTLRYLKDGWGRKPTVRIILFSLGSLLALFLVIKVSGVRFYIPERLIPSRWSDFEFWSLKAGEFKGWLESMESLEPIAQDILLRRWTAAGAVWGTLSCCLTVICLAKVRCQSSLTGRLSKPF